MPACPACGSPAPPGKRFCADCGASLDMTSARTRARRPDVEPGEERDAGGGFRFIPGTRIAGRYRIVGRLGRGGMGVVYRAEDLKLGQNVALKFLPPRLEEDPSRLGRLLNEVRLARQVGHPNVCRVYDAGEVDGRHFLSMEYVDGENLASLLRRIGRLPRDKAVELSRQICAGLHAAHDQGILHRDLKPANIMIDGRGRARITDFGLAVLGDEIHGEDIASGTPAYMAPEQLQGREVTARSDIYSLGLVLYELFTGKMAFTPGDREENLHLRLESAPSSPSDHVEGFDPAVERVILRCLEVDPAARPRSALEVSAALPGGDPLAAALAAGETPSPEMVAAAGQAETMAPGRAWTLAVLAVLLFVTAATVTGRTSIRAYFPELKPPEAMIDRARQIVAELGYTEPAYAKPADSDHDYRVNWGAVREIVERGGSLERLETMRDPSAGLVSFWYRQSPRPFRPDWRRGGGLSGMVEPWNPFPETTGEILVVLDPTGRLERFVALPRRFTPEPAGEEEPDADEAPDWSLAFSLAGLDPSGFVPDKPRYQRFMHLDRRAAWVPTDPGAGYRIEAGGSEGRLALFAKVRDEVARRLAAEPGPLAPGRPDFLGWFFFLLLVIGAAMARSNHLRGRADGGAAVRVGILYGGLNLLARILPAHEMFHVTALAFAVLSGFGAAVIYMALEPYARAIWPSMLLSWTRLIGSAGVGWRDPAVGRAVLAGMMLGPVVGFLGWLVDLAGKAWLGMPIDIAPALWESVRGTREALGVLATAIVYGVSESIMATFLLVLARRLLKRPALAVAGAGVLWMAPDLLRMITGGGDPVAVSLIQLTLFNLPVAALVFGTLLRWGLTGSIALGVTGYVGYVSAAVDWGAWHAEPAILGVVLISALALYGVWAATGGRRPAGRLAGAGAAPAGT